jgi:hypothetical protein
MNLKTFKRHVVGIVCEMLMQRDPYSVYVPPCILHEECDSNGNVIRQIVRANSGTESTRHLQGTTISGDRHVVSTHLTNVRRGLYDVHIEDWDNE